MAMSVNSSMGHHPPVFRHRRRKSFFHQCVGTRSVVAFPGPDALEFGFVSSGKMSGGRLLRWVEVVRGLER